MILISEDVWGAPFEEIQGSFSIVRDDNLWNNPEELKAKLATAQVLVVRNRTQVTAEIMRSAPLLKVIARAGVGLDNIDVKSADELGIIVVAGLGANAVSVAELTLGLALSLARSIPSHDVATKDSKWIRTPGREISGSTWGLLGCGATALATARLLTGFGARIVGYDPFLKADDPRLTSLSIELCSFDEVLAESDIVSVHMPATPDTVNSINARALALMKPHALLINVGRGEVINEEDLLNALHNKIIAGAALDVRAQEPPIPSVFEKAPNILLTPHIAGITGESQLRINQILVQNIQLVLSGKPAVNAVGKNK